MDLTELSERREIYLRAVVRSAGLKSMAELAKKLESTTDDATLIRWVSEKVLESYKNGITAGQKGATVIRKGASRRHGLYPKAQ